MNTKKYITTVELSPDGNAYILLPPELIAKHGWDEHTLLCWRINDDKTITLTNTPHESEDINDA